jgi:hypothetical protein
MEQFHVELALRYSEWALEYLMLPPVGAVFVLAAVSSVWSGLKQRPFQKHLWKRHYWLVPSHLLFFVAAIVVGSLWVGDPRRLYPASRAATVWLDTVMYGSLASCVFWIWHMKGLRWFAASLMVLAEVLTFGAIFVAGMSISGDWL